MVERPLGDQHAQAPEVLDDLRVRLPHREPREVLHVGDESPGVVHGVVDLEPERLAELVVLLAVAGRDVDEAGSLVHRDELRRRDLPLTGDPRVAEPVADQALTVEVGEYVVPGLLEEPEEVARQRPRHDVDLTADLERDIALGRVDRDREIGRQRPRRRRPDHREDGAATERRLQIGRNGGQRKLDPHRRRLLILVLDLGLGQSRLAVHAPVDRLESLVDQTTPDEAAKLPGDDGLICRLHRDVRVVPVPEDAEALELAALDVDVVERVLSTPPALLDRVHGAAHVGARLVETELLVDLMLDREPMAIPARHVDGVEAHHRVGLDDHVLQDLVEHGPEMDVAVSVRRAVMEDPQRPADRGLTQALVDSERGPPGEHLRLALRKISLHRKGRFRQI